MEASPTPNWRRISNHLSNSIGTKIIVPYLLLTLAVAGVGAFLVVRFTTDSLQERFYNQLLDAGRVVSERMVDYEAMRLEILRVVVATEGVAESLAANKRADLAARVPQIIANSNTDAVELLDQQGREVYGWQRPPNQAGTDGEERFGADFSHLQEVRRVLDGVVDKFGEKRVLLSQTPYGLMIFTVGPVYQGNKRVGAALVGTYVHEMVIDLTESAVAKVTLYDPQGQVIETTLGGGQKGVTDILSESPEQYRTVLALLRESPDRYPVVVTKAQDEVPFKQAQILGLEYTLAYGDWRLRGQSLGLFSVALPNNFIVSTAATSRNLLALLFSAATVGVFALGFFIAQRIIQPLQRLVRTSKAVAQGDLAQRTGIQRGDEIGTLAYSFDTMTDRLVERNRQLVEQASKLKAILDSIADGVIVLDWQGVIISSNPAARQILADVSSDFLSDILQELASPAFLETENGTDGNQDLELAKFQQPRRYRLKDRTLSALIAPMITPGGETLGTVIALRDVTREADSEQLKDNFITNISHELRTPLTAIKGYSDLLLMSAQEKLSAQQSRFVQTINHNTDKLLHHINQLIDISEIQAGTLRLDKQELCFEALVKEITEQWRERLEAKGLSLQLTLPAAEIRLCGDPKRLNWAIDNLLSNAYNYTLSGGRVEVRVFQAEAEAQLDVLDTGVGIAVGDQPYLFTRFFRAAHPLTFNVPGVGLGLFITRSIVELHEGRVWVQSKLNEGSTFSLALPLLK